MKEALEDKFLHCSKRLNHDLQGFRDAASKEQAEDFPDIYTGKVDLQQGADLAPHMSPTVIHGIAMGFLQIQPEAMSTAILEELDDDNVNPTI